MTSARSAGRVGSVATRSTTRCAGTGSTRSWRRPLCCSWLIDSAQRRRHPENGNGAAGPSNAAGYPHLTVPAGFVEELPVGLSFMASAWEEPKLLRLGHAFERAVGARRPPRFLRGWGVEDFVPR